MDASVQLLFKTVFPGQCDADDVSLLVGGILPPWTGDTFRANVAVGYVPRSWRVTMRLENVKSYSPMSLIIFISRLCSRYLSEFVNAQNNGNFL